MSARRGFAFAFFLTGLITSGAFADTTAADKAVADSLFQEGRALLGEGKVEAACLKFEASQRTDPSVGTSLNLGACYEDLGRTASAYGAFGEAARLGRQRGDAVRVQAAVERQRALEGKLSRLQVDAPFPVKGLEVRVDGRGLDAGILGAAVPMDPGQHVVEASAPGRAPFREEVALSSKAGVKKVYVPELAALGAPAAEDPREVTVLRGEREGDAPLRAKWGRVALVGVGGAVVGMALMGVGAWSGRKAKLENNESTLFCDDIEGPGCDERGFDLRVEAGHYADVSTGFFVGGSVLVAAGAAVTIVALVKRPSPSEVIHKQALVVPVVAPGYGGAALWMEF